MTENEKDSVVVADSRGVGYPKMPFRPLGPFYNANVPDTREGAFGKCGMFSTLVVNPAGSTTPIIVPISGTMLVAQQVYTDPDFPALLPNTNTEEWDISLDDMPGMIRLSSIFNNVMAWSGDLSMENFAGSCTFYRRGSVTISGVAFGKVVVTPRLGLASYLRITTFERPIGIQIS